MVLEITGTVYTHSWTSTVQDSQMASLIGCCLLRSCSGGADAIQDNIMALTGKLMPPLQILLLPRWWLPCSSWPAWCPPFPLHEFFPIYLLAAPLMLLIPSGPAAQEDLDVARLGKGVGQEMDQRSGEGGDPAKT
jgi:hypothetical protein